MAVKSNTMKIYELVLDEETDGVHMIALVDEPAIKRNFLAFKDEFEDTFNDYPQAASDNAQKALDWIDEYGDEINCNYTPVGLARAKQLSNRENISWETIGRMSSFNRHRDNSVLKDENRGTPWKQCGYLAWMLWGGDEGVDWAMRMMDRKDEMHKMKHQFKIQDEEKRIVMGAIMVANLPIYRYNEDMGDHYVVFRPNVIEQAVLRFFKERRNDQANIMHDGVKVDGVYLYESFIIDDRKPTPIGFDKLPNGSWFGTFKVENDDVWERVKKGEFAGFSIEGFFGYAPDEKEKSDDLLAKILSVLEP